MVLHFIPIGADPACHEIDRAARKTRQHRADPVVVGHAVGVGGQHDAVFAKALAGMIHRQTPGGPGAAFTGWKIVLDHAHRAADRGVACNAGGVIAAVVGKHDDDAAGQRNIALAADRGKAGAQPIGLVMRGDRNGPVVAVGHCAGSSRSIRIVSLRSRWVVCQPCSRAIAIAASAAMSPFTAMPIGPR